MFFYLLAENMPEGFWGEQGNAPAGANMYR